MIADILAALQMVPHPWKYPALALCLVVIAAGCAVGVGSVVWVFNACVVSAC